MPSHKNRWAQRIARSADAIVACLLITAHIGVIAATRVLPGHDLPQHIAAARVIADRGAPGLPLFAAFAPPHPLEPYGFSHHVLAAMAHLVPVDVAARLVLAVYAVALPLSFAALVTAVDGGPRRAARACALATVAIWNPVVLMGFLSFALALPVFFAGAALHVRAARSGGGWNHVGSAACGATLWTLHPVAACAFVLAGALDLALRPSRKVAAAAGVGAAGVVLGVSGWKLAGSHAIAAVHWDDVERAVHAYGVADGLARAFRASFASPGEKAHLAFATALGALPAWAKLAVAAAFAPACLFALARLVAFARRPQAPRGFARAALAFAALALAAPTAIQVPNDICLIDLRLFVLAGGLVCAAAGLRAFDGARPRAALLGAVAFTSLLWCRQVLCFGEEASDPLQLIARLGPEDVLIAAPLNDRSAHFDESNALTHYLPVYHTALNGGLTTSFWGGFTAHLPVAYAEGREPLHPPDWEPWRVDRAHFAGATALLLELPDEDAPPEVVAAVARIEAMDGAELTRAGAAGRWRLYRIRRERAVTG